MLQRFLVILCVIQAARSFDVNDPCLTNFCNFGELCIRSIDGLSYNCVDESFISQTSQLANQPFNNYPVNYFLKYLEPNPCLSSPCQEKQICRVLNMRDYVCVNELELPSDIAHLRTIDDDLNSFQKPATGFLKRLKVEENLDQTTADDDEEKYVNVQDEVTDQNEKKMFNLNITIQLDESSNQDDDVMNQVDVNQTDSKADKCANQPNGKRLANDLDPKTYIECNRNVSTIKNCLLNLVFNSLIEKCSKSLEKPSACLPNPCMNGGRCVEQTTSSQSASQYRCDCRSGFTGNHCENKDVCQANICGSKGICLSIGFTSPISHLCWCSKGEFLGLDCNKMLETNPCLNTDSRNKKFPLALNPSIYVLCDKTRPIVKFCQNPLVFSATTGDCDWADYNK